MPGAAAPPAARSLPFRSDYRATRSPRRRALHQQGIRRRHAVEHLDRKPWRPGAQRGLYGAGAEQRQRRGQAVTTATHLEDFESRSIERVQRVPDAAARHAKRARHRLAGTEFTIGEHAQSLKGQRIHLIV